MDEQGPQQNQQAQGAPPTPPVPPSPPAPDVDGAKMANSGAKLFLGGAIAALLATVFILSKVVVLAVIGILLACTATVLLPLGAWRYGSGVMSPQARDRTGRALFTLIVAGGIYMWLRGVTVEMHAARLGENGALQSCDTIEAPLKAFRGDPSSSQATAVLRNVLAEGCPGCEISETACTSRHGGASPWGVCEMYISHVDFAGKRVLENYGAPPDASIASMYVSTCSDVGGSWRYVR